MDSLISNSFSFYLIQMPSACIGKLSNHRSGSVLEIPVAERPPAWPSHCCNGAMLDGQGAEATLLNYMTINHKSQAPNSKKFHLKSNFWNRKEMAYLISFNAFSIR